MAERFLTPEGLRRISKVLVPLLLLAVIVYAWPSKAQKTATVYFSRTVHIYKGGDVDVLGVKVGSITGVQPDGNQVKVTIKYNASQHIPANASAVILTPTLVADRVVQLTPAYSGGPVLAEQGRHPAAENRGSARAGSGLREPQRTRPGRRPERGEQERRPVQPVQRRGRQPERQRQRHPLHDHVRLAVRGHAR